MSGLRKMERMFVLGREKNFEKKIKIASEKASLGPEKFESVFFRMSFKE